MNKHEGFKKVWDVFIQRMTSLATQQADDQEYVDACLYHVTFAQCSSSNCTMLACYLKLVKVKDGVTLALHCVDIVQSLCKWPLKVKP